MLETFNMAIPTKAILSPTITYIGAFESVRWKRSSEVEARVGGGGGSRGWRWGSKAEVKAETEVEAEGELEGESEAKLDVRVRISCVAVVELVVQASVFARGVSIPVFVYQSISVCLLPVSD